jgi:hypothetical protein
MRVQSHGEKAVRGEEWQLSFAVITKGGESR